MKSAGDEQYLFSKEFINGGRKDEEYLHIGVIFSSQG